ncbi:MAG: hypothetical protein FI695_00090 [SAR202 cluster bacterium]|nr:hypothetical protein [SAR202 cluster bacterium]|tara:strand:+ start:1670 stop:3625 length:1956 start_codon:yes stop_codon:yes gene_type:complete
MIVLRRLLIPPLLVVFVVFIFPLILLVYARAVLLDSEFYMKNYTNTNISDRVYNNILPTLIDETLPGQLKGDNYNIKDDVYRILTNTIPSTWVDQIVLMTLSEFIPYLTGINDHASVYLDVKKITDQLVIELNNNEFKTDIYNAVTHATVEDISIRVKNAEELPLGINLEKSDVELLITSLLYYKWYESTYDTTLDTAYNYLSGETETFELNIKIKNNIREVLEPFKQLLQEQNVYNVAIDKAGGLILSQFDLNSFDLPEGVAFNNEFSLTENSENLSSNLDQNIVNQIGDDLVDQIYLYLIGKSKTMDIEIDIKELTPVINQLILKEAEKQLDYTIEQLPICSTEVTLSLLSQTIDTIPNCYPQKLATLPDSIELRLILAVLSINFDDLYIYDKMLEDSILDIKTSILQEVESILNNNIPTNYVFTEDELNSYLSPVQLALIEEIRLWTIDGLNFDEEYLNQFYIGLRGYGDSIESQENHLEKIRNIISSGYTVTEKDLRPHLDTYLNTNLVRKIIKSTGDRYIKIILYILAVLFIISIGILGGQTWYGRLGWSAIPILITSVVTFATLNGAYSFFLKNLITQAFTQSAQSANLKAIELTYNELNDVSLTIIDGFLADINTILVPFILISFGLIANAVIIHNRKIKKIKN